MMYCCCHPKRLWIWLLLDAAALVLWVLLLAPHGAAAETVPEGVPLPVIMYHSLTDPPRAATQLSPAAFADDLAYLEAHGYETVSAAQLAAYTRGTGDLPEKPILLTFDDGFYNNLSDALPLLEAHDMCAVVSIVGRYTDEIAPADPHVPAYSYLTWEDVAALLASGRIEIGSHTWDLHENGARPGCAICPGEDADTYQQMLRDDLSRLQARMQEMCGTVPTVFAYPYGFVCPESVPVLREMGFTCTLTCLERPNVITRDPDCLLGLFRYDRTPDESTEAFFSRALAAD